MEIWKVVEGYENYQVSNLGRVKGTNGQIMKVQPHRMGYAHVNFYRKGRVKGFNVSRLVAAAFAPNWSPDLVVGHRDGDKQNNCIDNLLMLEHRENTLRSLRRLGKKRGAYLYRNKWVAQITVNQQKIQLGTFDTEGEAQLAYYEYYLKTHGVAPWN